MVPLHILEGIVSFSYRGASPSLMGECVKRGIQLSFFSPRGRYLASASGTVDGNVFLRRQQYRYVDDEESSLRFAQNFIYGKIYNARYFLLKFGRSYAMRVNQKVFNDAADAMKKAFDLKTETDWKRDVKQWFAKGSVINDVYVDFR